MKDLRRRVGQLILMLLFQAVLLTIVAWILPGFEIVTVWSLLAFVIAFGLAQGVFWWLFVQFFARFPVWLYPVTTFLVNGIVLLTIGRQVRGVVITDLQTAIWITVGATAVNALVGGLLSLDEDAQFDLNVTQRMVNRRGRVPSGPMPKSDVPGFVFFEIDGLAEPILRRAIHEGHMPTLSRWLRNGTHRIQGWETDFSSQTGAMQSGILLGSNDNIPAYRWWDRASRNSIAVGSAQASQAVERRLSDGYGLLSHGGTSRGNMFSGDAAESLFTFSTLLDRSRATGPSFYMFLVNPYVVARLMTRYLAEVVKEMWQQLRQRLRKDKYRIPQRNIFYAFFRGVLGPFLQDLTTYTVISDVLRGVPAVYALYGGYDDLAHFAGRDAPEAFEGLSQVDRYLARIEHATGAAPRPYHLVVLSDHGQVTGPTFRGGYGRELRDVVAGLVHEDVHILAELDTNEGWDNINAVLTESITGDSRAAAVLRQMLKSKERDGAVVAAPQRTRDDGTALAEDADLRVFASGCAGLVYFTASPARLAQEQIQDAHPDLILGLVKHPGIGWVMVHSEAYGPIVIGKHGFHYLADGKVEGEDPLADYGPNAPCHLRRETSFADCPDLLVNSVYDPATGEMPGFEHQVSHHGGLGGDQNRPFILYPTVLREPDQPLLGAESVCRLLRGWREEFQGIPRK